jgi:hypothetical protein
LGAILCRHFEKSRVYRPKVRIANRQISRGSSAQRPGYRPTHVLHATIPSGSGPARKHTAKFDPAAWSWAQMTSGSGARKRVLRLSEEAIRITFKLQRPNLVPRLPSQALKTNTSRFYPHQRCCQLCTHNSLNNSFGVGSANPSKHAPLRKTRVHNLKEGSPTPLHYPLGAFTCLYDVLIWLRARRVRPGGLF